MNDQFAFSDLGEASTSNSSRPNTPITIDPSTELECTNLITNTMNPIAPSDPNSNSRSQLSIVTTLTNLEARWEMLWNRTNSSSHWYLSPGSTKPMRQRSIQPQSRHLTANDNLISKDNCWYLRTFICWEPREILLKDDMCQRLLSEWEFHPKVSRTLFLENFELKFVGITRAELIVLLDVLERTESEVSWQDSFGEDDALVENVAMKMEAEEVDLETSPPALFELYGIDELVVVLAYQTPYIFTEAQIAKESNYFHKKIVESIRRKEDSCVVRVPKTSSSTFEMFTDWLKTGIITPTDTSSTSIDQLIELYIFSDTINSKEFQNRAMDEIQDVIFRQWFDHKKKGNKDYKPEPVGLSSNQIRKIFEHTKTGYNHHLRQFCAATVSHWILALDNAFINRRNQEPNYLESCMKIEGFGKEFAFYQSDIVNRELRQPRSPKSNTLKDNPGIRGVYKTDRNIWTGFDICFFHAHAEDTPCDSSANFELEI